MGQSWISQCIQSYCNSILCIWSIPSLAACGDVTNGLTLATNDCTDVLTWHHDPVHESHTTLNKKINFAQKEPIVWCCLEYPQSMQMTALPDVEILAVHLFARRFQYTCQIKPMSMVQQVGSCKRGHFLFTCSDTFIVGCIIQPQCTASHTDDSMMPIANVPLYDQLKICHLTTGCQPQSTNIA